MATDPASRPTDISRRRLVVAGAALAGAAAAAPAQPQAATAATPRAKGPRVWRDFDQADLDEGYDVPKATPNLRQVTQRWLSNSELARSLLGPPLRLAYGPTAVEAMDVYTTTRSNAPFHVFLHGGAFNLGRAGDFAFLAETFVRAGAHFVAPDFARAQDVGGDVVPLMEQARRAVAWLHRNARSRFGGNPDGIYISGHSSGAALASDVLATDWRADFGLPADLVKGGLLCSTTYDMRSFRLSAASAAFRISDASEDLLSVQRHIDRLNAPVIVAFGSLDTAFFQADARSFVAAVQAAGKPARLLVADGYNHLEVIETLGNPYGVLGRAMLGLMGLGS